MSKKLNVLVLGAGGNVSQGIIKALASTSLPVRVVGACISPLSPGLYMTEKAYVSPLAADPHFLDWLIDTLRTERIDAVFSGVEPNLTVMAEHAQEIHALSGATCVVSRPEVLAIGDDKLKTCQWLESEGLNFPRYAASSDAEAAWRLVSECGYPLIAKPRSGRGAIGILTIHNQAGLEYALSQPDYVLQEYLGNDESEYTIGCFVDRDGQLRGAIVMRRQLQQGTTCRAELGDFPEVRQQACRIACALKPTGPANVQMRVSHGKPVCFEINVRFSGTTPIRARFGWNDVELALRHFVLNEPAYELPPVTSGIAVRYWEEIYVDQRAPEKLEHCGSLHCPQDFKTMAKPHAFGPN